MNFLPYLLERIYNATQIPLRVFCPDRALAKLTFGYASNNDPASSPDIYGELLAKAKHSKKPALYFDRDSIIYGLMNDKSGCVIIFGPIFTRQPECKELELHIKRYTIAQRTLIELCAAISIVHYASNDEPISELDILANSGQHFSESLVDAQAQQRYRLNNTEEEIVRLSYSDELSFLKYIKEGDLEGIIKRKPKRGSENSVVRLAAKPLKQLEYMVCTSLALMSRAAIESGVLPDIAYPVSDLYFQQLEKCHAADDFIMLHMNAAVKFTGLVKQAKDDRAKVSYIESCKSFISNHLNKAFTLSDVAEYVGVNKTYLSRRFSEEMGMGISKYTQLKRIDASKNLLKYSDADISSIAEYLCFSSQSHFGEKFRKIVGVTPHKYRQQQKIIDL